MRKNKNKNSMPPKEKTPAEKSKTTLKLPSLPVTNSFLDIMEDGREFESLLKYRPEIEIISELKRGLRDISNIRGKVTICYLANVVKTTLKASPGIDNNDDLPFSEMINSIPQDVKDLDIVLVTPGGSATQVSRFVDRLRPRFESISFILPNMAMSAGTIFVASGDEIIMDSRSYIGPIDPQVRSKEGQLVPAQSILTLITEIQNRGENLIKSGQNPMWSDLQILRQLDPKEIGFAMNASKYSIELVENYLYNYKFRTWHTHSTTGKPVTDNEKKERAKEIAELLCNHSEWKTHLRGITREAAWEVCKLKITHAESIEGLERAIRRFWALTYWVFENTAIFKMFLSENYVIVRSEKVQINNK